MGHARGEPVYPFLRFAQTVLLSGNLGTFNEWQRVRKVRRIGAPSFTYLLVRLPKAPTKVRE